LILTSQSRFDAILRKTENTIRSHCLHEKCLAAKDHQMESVNTTLMISKMHTNSVYNNCIMIWDDLASHLKNFKSCKRSSTWFQNR